jgi:hypothetical protein
MSSNPAKPFLVRRGDDPQLQLLNEKIARLAGCKPAGDAFGAFALAAHLADLAIEAALELGQMPGVDMKALQPTVKFWKVVAVPKKKKVDVAPIAPEKNPAAVALGRMGGRKTAERGTDYYRDLAAKRKTHGGGRPRKDNKPAVN